MNIETYINGKKFIKSTFSSARSMCVGVAIEGEKISIINTNDREENIINFNLEEWDTFIKGVKNGEFDI